MTKKLLLVAVSALILGGCNLSDLWQKEAANDEKIGSTQTESQTMQDEVQMEPDPSVGTDNSMETLEADINGTVIYDEDFSDLE